MAENQRFVTRSLEVGDFRKGFATLLGQLTTIEGITETRFLVRFHELQAEQGRTFVRVIEDTESGKLVASATLVLEKKFIHNNGIIGHIEDVVVDTSYRGHNLGLRVIQDLIRVGQAAGCYKIILDCSEKNVPFYEKCGFKRKELSMALYMESLPHPRL
eukprot:TRINITY_DN13002_c0_g1_i1.p1 TRINITY_DN13002_c0_g1~~TRINITY_DN13002_c0_g1_i1.p1  ORF type:complete len:159 (+),score=7.02 TRINITY_DN13002_c0_g1_i1:188-664(+)